MAVSFPRFSWRFWGGSKERQPFSNGSSLNSSSDCSFGLKEPDTVNFPDKMVSKPRKGKGKWENSDERRTETDCDVVLVPSDGMHLSGYESDGPEWSIGWEEPHGPGFVGDDETDGGFAVLVPCYRPGCKELLGGPNNPLLSAFKSLPNGVYTEGNNYMQQWFSSLKNF
ncbi:hypothetical protein SLE2022_296900 [Rubroshorea leprosula]